MELFVAEGRLFEGAELGHDEVNHFECLVGGGACVDAERTGVAVGADIGIDGVGHAALFADGLEEARTHTAAKDGIEDKGGVAILIRDGRGGDTETDLDLLEGALITQDDGSAHGGGLELHLGRARRERAELIGDASDEFVVVQITGSGEDHVAGAEAVAVVVEQCRLLQAGDGLGGAEDGLADGLIFPEVLGEDLVDEDVRVVFVDLDLFEDDAAFALDIGAGEGGIEDQVGEDVERNRHVVGERFDAKADGFLAGEGVQVAADCVHFAGDVLGGARFGALEEHVFDEVGDAVDLGGLVAGAGLDPDAHGDRAEVFHALGEDAEAIGKDCAAQVALDLFV